MKTLAKVVGAALVGAFALLTAPAARAQVGVSVNIGAPEWGPPVPYGTQYYYIPEIDGYYDLYSQQYIVLQDGYWVPLPELYGYDPYQFHPVVVNYRGREPWQFCNYYHARYAYRPYQAYGPGRGGYYAGGYGRGYDNRYYYGNRGYYGGRDRYDRDRGDRDRGDHDRYDNRGYDSRDYGSRPRDGRGHANGGQYNGQNQTGGQGPPPSHDGYDRGNQSQPAQPAPAPGPVFQPRRGPGALEQSPGDQNPQGGGGRRDGRGRL